MELGTGSHNTLDPSKICFYYCNLIKSKDAIVLHIYRLLLILQDVCNVIEQKGMTLNQNFCYSFSFSSSIFFQDGRENGNRITKVVILNHAFLLDRAMCITPSYLYKTMHFFYQVSKSAHFCTQMLMSIHFPCHLSIKNKETKRKDCTNSFIIMYFDHLSNFIMS